MDGHGRERIDAALRAAERRTAAEIIVVVAARSGRYERAEDLGIALAALVALVCGSLLFQGIALLGVATAGGALGWLATRHHQGLARALVLRRRRRAQVDAAAEAILESRRHRHSRRDTGLVLYASRFERLAAVRADPPVREALGADALAELERELTAAVAGSAFADDFARALERVGARLATALPRAALDLGESAHSVVVVA